MEIKDLLYDITDAESTSISQKILEHRRWIGTARFNRGMFGDRKLRIIDTIPHCNREECGLFISGRCEPKGKKEICQKIHSWILNVEIRIFEKYQSLEDDSDFLDIGMILIPMYVQLFTIQKELDSMDYKPLTQQGTGSVKVNPLYELYQKIQREIRAYKRDLDAKILKPKQKKTRFRAFRVSLRLCGENAVKKQRVKKIAD